MGRLSGKAALVTGGALGIGSAACALLAAEGASVAVTDVLEDEGEKVASRINASGGRARFWRLDVTDEARVEEVVNEAAGEFGRLDVLVNNAGVSGARKPAHELTEEDWKRVMAVNLKGAFFCTKHAAPHMRSSGGGSIVNVGSVLGVVANPDNSPYVATKAALRYMSKADALTYAPDNIRVNCVNPGYVWTPLIEKYVNSTEDPAGAKEALAGAHPLGRLGTPEEVAWAIVYLASDEASFVTGSDLNVDGGYTAR